MTDTDLLLIGAAVAAVLFLALVLVARRFNDELDGLDELHDWDELHETEL